MERCAGQGFVVTVKGVPQAAIHMLPAELREVVGPDGAASGSDAVLEYRLGNGAGAV